MDFKKKLNKLILSGLVLGMLSCSNVANAEMNVLDAMDSLISNPSISREYYYNDSMNMPNKQSLSSDDVYKEGMNLLLNRDYIEAFMTLKSAADMGNPVAAYQVAWMYNNGDGISSNPNKCFEYFQKSAYGGYPLGEHYYAIYLLGVDPEYKINKVSSYRNTYEGLKWLTKAAQHGVLESYYIFGFLFERGWANLPKDYDKALQFWNILRMSNTGIGYALYGNLYLQETLLFKRDFKKAANWYEKAIENGYSTAEVLNNISYCYMMLGDEYRKSYYEGMLPKSTYGFVMMY